MRSERWEMALSEYLKEMKDVPFEWGRNDCILFAAKGFERLTGKNHYAEYLGYSTEEEAKKILESNGGFDGIIGKHIGPSKKDWRKAKRGDVCLMKIPHITCGIVDDSGRFVAVPSEKGLVRRPLSDAWRVWIY